MTPCLETRRTRVLLGALVGITASAPNEQRLEHAVGRAFAAVGEVHRLMNPHDPASDLNRINQAKHGQPLTVHCWTRQLLRAAQHLAAECDGAFEINAAREGSWRDFYLEDDGRIVCRRAVMLELEGVALAFALDRAVDALLEAGVFHGLVNAGSSFRAFGSEPQVAELRHPLHPGHDSGMILLQNRALAIAAGHFTRDSEDQPNRPPTRGEICVTVGAADCLTANVLAKVALSLRDAAQPLLDRHDADALLLEHNLPPPWSARSRASPRERS